MSTVTIDCTPFILGGRDLPEDGGSTEHGLGLLPEVLPTLWAVWDGVLILRPAAGPELTLTGPAVALVDAATTVQRSPGVRAGAIAFDLLARSHRTGRQGRGYWFVEDPPRRHPALTHFLLGETTVLPAAGVPAAIRLVKRLLALWWVSPSAHFMACMELGVWLAGLMSVVPTDRLVQARDLVRRQVRYGLTVAELAAHLGLGEDAFLALCRRAGLTPTELIDAERMAMACDLLRSTDLPVARIAHLTGWQSHSAFTRRFRQCQGSTPQVWRTQPPA